MKAAVLIYETASGKLEAIPGRSLDPLMDAAKAARVAGLIGKTPVVEGVVLCNWRHSQQYRFRAEPPAPVAKSVKPKA